MLILVPYLVFCVVVGYVASQRGRSGLAWCLVAFLLTPLFSIIVLALLPSHVAAPASLDEQIRVRTLEQQFESHIRAHKPAFSSAVVFDVDINGEQRRFKTKAEAIAFCVPRVSAAQVQSSPMAGYIGSVQRG